MATAGRCANAVSKKPTNDGFSKVKDLEGCEDARCRSSLCFVKAIIAVIVVLVVVRRRAETRRCLVVVSQTPGTVKRVLDCRPGIRALGHESSIRTQRAL